MAEPAPVAVTEELLHRLVATMVPVTAGAEEPAAADWLEMAEVGTTTAEDEAALEVAAALEVETAALELVALELTALEVVGLAVLWLK
jgi:hypothetical protein